MERGEFGHSTLAPALQASCDSISAKQRQEASVATLLSRAPEEARSAHGSGEPSGVAHVSLPEPGSPEALEMYLAACKETDRLDRDAVHGYPELKRTNLEWWTRDTLGLALEAGELMPADYAMLYQLASEREHRISSAALATGVGALHALAFAEQYGQPRPAPTTADHPFVDDSDLLQIGVQFDAAHHRWRETVEAALEALGRHHAALAAAKSRGHLTMADHEAAEALPGYREVTQAEEEALDAVARLSERALKMQAHSIQGLAVQARCLIPCVWPTGSFEAKAALGSDEDVELEAVRLMIESCCAAAGVDWRGRPTAGAAGPGDQISDSLWAAIYLHRDTKIAFEAAARAADKVQARNEGRDHSEAALKPAEAQSLAASHAHDQAYRDLLALRPQSPSELLLMLRHLAEHGDDHRGIEDEPDVFGSLIGAVEGMCFASLMPTARYDLSRLSIEQLKLLADIAHRKSEDLMAVENQPFCWLDGRRLLGPLGKIIGAEHERMSLLRDFAVAEIERRRPLNKTDVDLRLEAMVTQHLLGNGYIEPKLLAEVVATWGAR